MKDLRDLKDLTIHHVKSGNWCILLTPAVPEVAVDI